MFKISYKKIIVIGLFAALITAAGFVIQAHAQADVGLNQVGVGLNNSLSATDPRTTAARIINIALGFLGVVAVVIIIYAGFLWMTAAGNEQQIDKAKKTLRNGIIGLIIIFMAWGITYFVLNWLFGPPGPGERCNIIDPPRACGCGGTQTCQSDGTWGSCQGSSCPITPIEPNFYVSTTNPQNFNAEPTDPEDKIIRNVVVSFVFNNDVFLGSEVDNFHVYQIDAGGNETPINGTIKLSGREISFTPDENVYKCESSTCSNFCYPIDSHIRARVDNRDEVGGGVKSILINGENLSLRPNCNSTDLGDSICQIDFYVGNIVDCENPTVKLITSGQKCIDTDNNLGFETQDDSGVRQIKFSDNNSNPFILINSNNNPYFCPPSGPPCGKKDFFPDPPTNGNPWWTINPFIIWHPATDYIAGNQYTITLEAIDQDSHSAQDNKTFTLRAAHCCNGIQDGGEEGLDCGGPDCAGCAGAACANDLTQHCLINGNQNCNDDNCASDFCNCGNYLDGAGPYDSCQEKGYTFPPANPNECCVCENKPIIDWISPVGGFCNGAGGQNTFCRTDSDCSAFTPNTCNTTTPNGAAGNFVTIGGRYFGTAEGRLYFANRLNPEINNTVHWVEARLADDPTSGNPACGSGVWTDKQIIAIVPSGISTDGVPIKVVSANDFSDTTDDARGATLGFTFNNIYRPGICKLNPNHGTMNTEINYLGIKLTNNSTAYFGNLNNPIIGLTQKFTGIDKNRAGSSAVPALTTGLTTTFASSTKGVNSNFLNFTKDEEPYTGPFISSISPALSAPGQYITIRGGVFGNTKGASQVFFDTNVNDTTPGTEASYAFPQVCADSVWSDKQVIVKTPTLPANEQYYIVMKIVNNKGEFNINSSNALPNTTDYNPTYPLAPSLCKLQPIMGPPATEVSMWGEYFGDNTTGQVHFQKDIFIDGSSIANWGQLDGGAMKNATVVPTAAVSGPVSVKQPNNDGNGLNFDVGLCTKAAYPNLACGNQICCPQGTYKEGRCENTINDCYSTILSSVYEWDFSTGITGIGTPCHSTDTEIENGATCNNHTLPLCDTQNGYNLVCDPNNECTCQISCDSDLKTSGCQKGTCPSGFSCNDNCICEANSCQDRASLTNRCDPLLCPNSPGTCSGRQNNEMEDKGKCDLSCNNVAVCRGNKCNYNPTLNTCVDINIPNCDLSKTVQDALGKDVKAFCQSYNSINRWHIRTTISCPSGWTMLYGGFCVDLNSTCLNCNTGFTCTSQPGNTTQGVCANDSGICPPETSCRYGIKVSQGSSVNYFYPTYSSVKSPAGFYGYSGCSAHIIDYSNIVVSDRSEIFTYYDQTNKQFSIGFIHDFPSGTTDPDCKLTCCSGSNPINPPPAGCEGKCDCNGGSVSFNIINNSAANATLAVNDDTTEGGLAAGDLFAPNTLKTWAWGYGADCTDGGMIEMPAGSWSITIDPVQFSRLNNWVFAYEDSENGVFNLSMTEPVTISYSGETRCFSQTANSCECCCRLKDENGNPKTDFKEDCCSPLICNYNCGTDASGTDTNTYGYCSGCANAGTTQAAHNAACNCAGTSGKYCHIDSEHTDGICVDCAGIGSDTTKCSTEGEGTCCVDGMNSSNCRGGDDMFVSGGVNYCAYYNCATSPATGCNTSPQSTGEYTESTCNNQCGGNGPGEECIKPGTNSCSTSMCANPTTYPCLTNEDCRCCCNPGPYTGSEKDTCPNINPILTCKANQTPCSGANRGLCCGCKADTNCVISHCSNDLNKVCENDGDCGEGNTCNPKPELVGCGNDTCCRERPNVLYTTPTAANPTPPNNPIPNDGRCSNDGAISCITNADCGDGNTCESANLGKGTICRNALIRAKFDVPMDIDSLTNNVLVIGDYGTSLCPTDTDFVAKVVDKQTLIAKIWNTIKKVGAKILSPISKTARAYTAPVPSHNYCAARGSVRGYNQEYELGKNGTVMEFAPSKVLDGDKLYYVLIKGDTGLDSKQGVLSSFGIGMNGPNDTNNVFNTIPYNNSFIWSFRTMSAQAKNNGICTIDSVEVKPKSYLFQSVENDLNENDTDITNPSFDSVGDSDKVFEAIAKSADKQALQPLPGVYNWTWGWILDNALLGTVTSFATKPNSALVRVNKTATEGQGIVTATATLSGSLAPAAPNNTISGKADVYLMICKNPWPPILPSGEWYPWRDPYSGTCIDNLCSNVNKACIENGDCSFANYNYEIYYCRDAGQPGTFDDLPALNSDNTTTILGSGLKVCNGGLKNNKKCSDNEDCLPYTCDISKSPNKCADGPKAGSSCLTNYDCNVPYDSNYSCNNSLTNICSNDYTKSCTVATQTTDCGPGNSCLSQITVCANGPKKDKKCVANPTNDDCYDYLCSASSLKETYFFRERSLGAPAGDITIGDTPAIEAGGSVDISWPIVTGAQTYKIYWGLTDGSHTSNQTASCSAAPCAATINGLINNTPYYFNITSITPQGAESGFFKDKDIEFTPKDTVAPSVPQNFTVQVIPDKNQIKLSWKANTDDTKSYIVYLGTSFGIYGFSKDVGSATDVILNISNPDAMYFVTVTAIDKYGNESNKIANQKIVIPSEGDEGVYRSSLTQVDFEGTEQQIKDNGWKFVDQKNSKITVSSAKSFDGHQSILITQAPNQSYPGTCTQAICTNLTSVNGCAWNSNQCSFPGLDNTHSTAPAVYNSGQTLSWGNTNRVMWASLLYQVGNLQWEVGKNYIIAFYYQGKLALPLNVSLAYALGDERQCMEYTNVSAPTYCLGSPACADSPTQCCKQATDPTTYQRRCYQAYNFGTIAPGEYNNGPYNGWNLFLHNFTYTAEMDGLRRKNGLKSNEIGLVIKYGPTGDGTELYIDDFVVAQAE